MSETMNGKYGGDPNAGMSPSGPSELFTGDMGTAGLGGMGLGDMGMGNTGDPSALGNESANAFGVPADNMDNTAVGSINIPT